MCWASLTAAAAHWASNTAGSWLYVGCVDSRQTLCLCVDKWLESISHHMHTYVLQPSSMRSCCAHIVQLTVCFYYQEH
jgi:hypothetical protein